MRLRPCIRHGPHHAPQCPRRPRDRHLRWLPCLLEDPKPLTAAMTQERSVNIRHASRGDGCDSSGSLAIFAAIRRAAN